MKRTDEFQKRFERWKNGESYWDIVGRPLVKKEEPGISDEEKAELDSYVALYERGKDSIIQNTINYNRYKESLPYNLQTERGDYDLYGAYEADMLPHLEDDGLYHLASRNPRTGKILKRPQHPTYLKALYEDAKLGYFPVKSESGYTYTDTWKGNGRFINSQDKPKVPYKYQPGKDNNQQQIFKGDLTGEYFNQNNEPVYVINNNENNSDPRTWTFGDYSGKVYNPTVNNWDLEKERIAQLVENIKKDNAWIGKTADALHAIGEGAMMSNPYTAFAYGTAHGLNNISNGNYLEGGAEIALSSLFTPAGIKFINFVSNIPKLAEFQLANRGNNWARGRILSRELNNNIDNTILQTADLLNNNIITALPNQSILVGGVVRNDPFMYYQPLKLLPAPIYNNSYTSQRNFNGVPEYDYKGRTPNKVVDINYVKERNSAEKAYKNVLKQSRYDTDISFNDVYDNFKYFNETAQNDGTIPTILPSSEQTYQLGSNVLNELTEYINPILRRYGYKKIPTGLSDVDTRNELLKRIEQHRTFIRGVRIPNKLTEPKNYHNLRKLASEQLHIPYEDVTDDLMLQTAASYIAKHNTNHGKQGFYEALNDVFGMRPRSFYYPIYASNRYQVAENYANEPGLVGKAYKIRLPIYQNDNMSLKELWKQNEFPVVDVYGRLQKEHPFLSRWRSQELPFILKHGYTKYKQLADLAKKNALETTRRNGIFFYKRNKPLIMSKNDAERQENLINNTLSHYGFSKINGEILPNHNFKDYYDDTIKEYFNTHPNLEKTANSISCMNDFFESVANKDYNKAHIALSMLERSGFVTSKQVKAFYNTLKSDHPDPLKYINPKQILSKIKKYFYDDKVRNHEFLNELKKQEAAEFNKVFPINNNLFSENGEAIFTTEGVSNPWVADKKGNHFVLIGHKNTKAFDVLEELEVGKLKYKNRSHEGNIYPGITRSLGSLLPPILVYGLYNNDKTQK